MTGPSPVLTPVAGALWWLDQGATLVRLARHSKRPTGGASWQTTADPAVARGWFADQDTSYGVLCGVPLTGDPTGKLVAFDHDTYKPTARALHLPPALQQATPRGGTHYLYRAPLDLRLAANGEPALDVKGGDGQGYIVGAGSQIRIDDTLRYYRLPTADGHIPALPTEIAHRFAAAGPCLIPTQRAPVAVPADVPAVVHARLAYDPGAGHRSEYFHATVRTFYQRGYTEGETVALLTPWCAQTGKYTGQVATEVARVWGKLAADDPASYDQPEPPTPPSDVESASEPAAAASPTNPLLGRLLDLAQLARLPQPEPLLTNTLDRRTLTVLAGPWATGKTLIALDWALCIATGRFWLGEQVVNGGTTCYVAAEGAYGLSQRVAAWKAKRQQPVDPHLLQVLPDPMPLTDRRAVAQLVDLVTVLDCRLVVIDTVSRCMAGADENSAQDMSLVIDAADRLRKATADTTVLLLHHTGKDGTTIRGSSALEAGADVVYQTGGDERAITLKRTKRKDGLRDRCDRLRLEASADSVVAVGIDPREQPSGKITGTERALWDRLGDVFNDQPASAAQLVDATGKSRTTVYDALSRLVQRGLVRTVADGRGHRYERMPGADPDTR